MKHKQKIALLSVAAIPAMITMVPNITVEAASSQIISGTIANPEHIFDAKSQGSTTTPINATANTEGEFKEELKKQFENYSTKFSITYTGTTADVAKIITDYHQEFKKENEYVAQTFSSIHYQSSGYTNNVINFTVKYHTTEEQEQFVNNEISKIVGQITDNTMSDFAKAKAIHDYVVQHTTYSTNTQASPHSVYAILKEGKGISQGYALLTYRLLKAAELETHYISGQVAGGKHGWNLVKIGTSWYHMDTTWDDSTFSNVPDATSNFIRYKYFLLTDTEITGTGSHTIQAEPYHPSRATTSLFANLHNISNPAEDDSKLYFSHDNKLYKMDLTALLTGTAPTTPIAAAEKLKDINAQNLVHAKGWLYFSNHSPDGGGYLTKVQTNGENLTILDKTFSSKLKINDNDDTKLDYIKADGKPGQIALDTTSDDTAVNIANTLISAIDPAKSTYINDIIAAQLAFIALTTDEQDKDVPLKSRLTNAINDIQTNPIFKLMLDIALLDDKASDFVAKVTTADSAYLAMDQANRAQVTNHDLLKVALAKVGTDAQAISTVRKKIGELNTTNDGYYVKTKEARNAYNILSLAQRASLEVALKNLEEKEKLAAEDAAAVFNINYRIDLLNNQAASFKASVEFLRSAITNIPATPGTSIANKKTLITKMSVYNSAETTYKTYKSKVETLEDELSQLGTDPTFEDVQALYNRFLALNLAEREFLQPTTESTLLTEFAAATAKLNTAAFVDEKIRNLDVKHPNFITQVEEARAAYNALDTIEKAKITLLLNLQDAEQTVTNIKEVIALISAIPSTATNYIASTTSADTAFVKLGDAQRHVTNKDSLDKAKKNVLDAQAVTDAIAALSETSAPAKINAARAQYNALDALPKALVEGLDKLEKLELANNTATAADVKALIDAIDITKSTFVADVNAAYAAFEKLLPEQKALIDEERQKKLTDYKKLADPIDAVIKAIDAVLDTDPDTYKAKATTAIAMYDKLNEQHRDFVPNALRITDFTTNINAANAVIQAIDNLKASSSADELTAVEAQYTALSELQRKLVTNISKLEDLLGKEYGKEEAEAVIKMIDKLDETKKTFAVDVKRARDAYDKLSDKQKEYVTNYDDLLAAEKKVADLAGTSDIAQKLIAQIAAINNTSASFKKDVEAAKSAYEALSEEQQALINNYNVLKEHLVTYDAYAAQAKKLEDKINALSNSSPGYQAALAALQSEYNAFNAAQKAFVAEYAVKLLNAAQSGIDAVRNVTNMILALNPSRITFHADVANARAAYNALIKNHGVYLSAYLEEALEKAEALVEKDKTAARKVVNAINSLSSDSILKEIERARRVYNNLTALQRPLVTNLQTLIDFETGKLSYNTSGIPDGVDTDDKNTDTEETNPLPDFAAIPGERTAMTKSSKGDTYTAQIYVSDEVGNSERFILTTRANVTAIIPPTVTIVGDKTGTMAIEIQATSSRVSFKATIDKKPVTFATEVDIILESVPKNSVILRIDQFGNRVPATYTVDGDQYTIKTNGSDTFIITRSTTTFTDIQNDSHREFIEELAARNIIPNDGNGKFNPNQSITRAEFAVMMARALDIQPSTDTNFNDIRGKSYESEVQALYEIGIIQGVNSTTFNPNSTLTRQQAAMMVERMLDYVNVDTNVWESPQFTDAHLIADSAINAVALMQSLDIVSGKADGSFDPLGKLTRSQLAKILYKALQSADLL